MNMKQSKLFLLLAVLLCATTTGWRAFGPGSGSDDYGKLTVGDLMMVSSERIFTEPERVNGCWYRTQARVEPCTHPGYTADTCPYHKH